MLRLIERTRSLDETVSLIDEYVRRRAFAHIVSLNAENLVLATESAAYNGVYERAQVVLADGSGIQLAAKLMGGHVGDRIPGVDLVATLVKRYSALKIVFLGGRNQAASRTCAYFRSLTGESIAVWTAIDDVSRDDDSVITRVCGVKPDILFVAFGSPYQEYWIDKYQSELKGVICMGVGQSLDVYGGLVTRAPHTMQKLGMEWLYRLMTQPWRWRRQLRLIKFLTLLLREMLSGRYNPSRA